MKNVIGLAKVTKPAMRVKLNKGGGPEGSLGENKSKPVTFRGKQPHEFTPEEWGQFGEEHGVDTLGPKESAKWQRELEPIKSKSGKEFTIPGGVNNDKDFSYYDLLHLKSQGIDPNDLDEKTHQKIHDRMVSAMQPKGVANPIQIANQMIFGMVSPNQPLTPNELALQRAMIKGPSDLEKLASFIPYSYKGDIADIKQRQKMSSGITKKLGVNAAEEGGIGVSGSANYADIAEFAQKMRDRPDFFTFDATKVPGSSPSEKWSNHVARVLNEIRGLKAKTGSLASVWQSPKDAAISAIDRHMATRLRNNLFESADEQRDWENSVIAKFNADHPENTRVKNIQELLSVPGGRGHFVDHVLSYVNSLPNVTTKLKKTGEYNPSIPEGLRNVDWVSKEPEKMQIISGPYVRALEANDRAAKEAGQGLFSNQWMQWDRIRGRLEPHEILYPGLEKLPRMNLDQMKRVTSDLADAGYLAGTGTVNPLPSASHAGYFAKGGIIAKPKAKKPMDRQGAPSVSGRDVSGSRSAFSEGGVKTPTEENDPSGMESIPAQRASDVLGSGRNFTGFFSNITAGLTGAPSTKENYRPAFDISGIAPFSDEYHKHLGKFDDHIGMSIPGFREMQQAVGHAVTQTFPEGGDMLDIGASEGALNKAVSAMTNGNIRTVALDPNPSMHHSFHLISRVPNAEYALGAYGNQEDEGNVAWNEDPILHDKNGVPRPNPFANTPIPYYKPDRKFDVAHEAMVFQFMNNNRDAQVKRAKEMLHPHGILINEEKFVPGEGLEHGEFADNEAKKDAYKEQFFTKEDIAKKRAAILQGKEDEFAKEQQAKEAAVVGMHDLQVSPGQLERTLKKHFKHVVQIWDSGNFKGYASSDSPEHLQRFVQNLPDTNSEFSTVQTPRVVDREPHKSYGGPLGYAHGGRAHLAIGGNPGDLATGGFGSGNVGGGSSPSVDSPSESGPGPGMGGGNGNDGGSGFTGGDGGGSSPFGGNGRDSSPSLNFGVTGAAAFGNPEKGFDPNLGVENEKAVAGSFLDSNVFGQQDLAKQYAMAAGANSPMADPFVSSSDPEANRMIAKEATPTIQVPSNMTNAQIANMYRETTVPPSANVAQAPQGQSLEEIMGTNMQVNPLYSGMDLTTKVVPNSATVDVAKAYDLYDPLLASQKQVYQGLIGKMTGVDPLTGKPVLGDDGQPVKSTGTWTPSGPINPETGTPASGVATWQTPTTDLAAYNAAIKQYQPSFSNFQRQGEITDATTNWGSMPQAPSLGPAQNVSAGVVPQGFGDVYGVSAPQAQGAPPAAIQDRAGSMGSMPPDASVGRQNYTSQPSQPAPAERSEAGKNFDRAFAAAAAQGEQTFEWTNPVTGQTGTYAVRYRKSGGRTPYSSTIVEHVLNKISAPPPALDPRMVAKRGRPY